MDVLEIEAAAPRGATLFFAPLQKTVRGEIDVSELIEADAALLRSWGNQKIPGVVLGLDATGGYLRDRLYEPAARPVRTKLEASGLLPGPEREEFGPVHRPTWLFWLRRAVEAGLARVVAGTLPERIDGRPRKQFVSPEREDPRDERLDRLEEQNRKLLALLVATLPADKRRAVERELAGQEDT